MGVPFPSTQVRVPEAPPNPLEQYGQVLGIKGMLQQQQMRQMQIEEAKRQQQDQVAIRSVLSDPSIDWSNPLEAIKTVTAKAAAAKVSPDAIIKIRGSLADEAKKFADYDKTKRESVLADNDVMYQHATALLQAPPDQKEAMYQAIRAGLVQEGKAKPDSLPPQYPGDAWASTIRGSLGLTGATFKLTLEEEERKAKESKAKSDAKIAADEAAVNEDFLKRESVKHRAASDSEFERAFYNQFGRMPTQDELIKFRKATQTPQVVTVQTIDESGNPITKIVPKTAGSEFPTKPSNDEERRADLANNMEENLGQLEDIVKRRPELFGPLAGRMTKGRAWIGTDDPDIAKLGAIREYLGMASVGTHAMRNAQHVGVAADAVMNSYKNEPKAILAAIAAAKNSIQTFKQDIIGNRGNAETTPQRRKTDKQGGGGIRIIRDSDGRITGIE